MAIRKPGKRYRADAEGWNPLEDTFTLNEAVAKLKGFKTTKFDQTVDICLFLGIDPKQADQRVRSSMSLPHGLGKSKRVIAFVGHDKQAEAKEAGAVEVMAAEELVKKIEGGWMEFDVAVATPDMMRVVSKLARILGPRGLMPSPKSGTVTTKVGATVKEYAAGKIEFRNDDYGNVHAPIGKISFDPKVLEENAQFFIDAITKMKPATSKGVFVKKVVISGTMTPGVHVELGTELLKK